MPSISMKELLEAGVHFGHQTKRWNPKMKEYIFGERNGIYIVDLQKTLKLFKDAMRYVGEMAAQGKIVLFVGTKRQALAATETMEKFDLLILADGGGVIGQAGACRLGISRALVEFNAELRPRLKKLGFLTRDPRQHERKKYGQKGARKRFQFSKR